MDNSDASTVAGLGASSLTHAAKVRVDASRSDYGTIVLHWILVGTVFTSLLTGLRWSADREEPIAVALQGILPQGELWSWHIISAIVATLCMSAYGIYLHAARLRRRIALKRTVVLTMDVSPRLKWSAVNVALYWFFYFLITSLFATGVMLYIGWGGFLVQLHYYAAIGVALYFFSHVTSHYFYGGIEQLIRLFRPAPLRHYRGMTSRPLIISLVLGAAAAAVAIATNVAGRMELVVHEADRLPKLDGRLTDPVWRQAKPVFVDTQQGANLGGTGWSRVEMRAVRTRGQVAFAMRWNDPTRSLKRLPLIKRASGWFMLNNRAAIADETAYYEDKFSILFSREDSFGAGDSTHMGPKPLADKPAALHGRGLHYTRNGSLIDVWQWKASRGGMLGVMDDMMFGPPVAAKTGQVAGLKRYSAGYRADSGQSSYVYNYESEPPGGYQQAVKIRRLPKDYRATRSKLAPINLSANASDGAEAQWWMFAEETVPYSKERDATIPLGTVIPGVLIMKPYRGSRADVRAAARWNKGYWTLEVVRQLRTGNPDDLDIADGLYVWVAVFDRNQTRHTRHIRPIRLIMK